MNGSIISNEKKNWIKSLILLLFFALLLLVSNVKAESWRCGANVYWRKEGTTLYIEGSGPMDDRYYLASVLDDNTVIKKVVVQEGVTHIGNYSFMGESMKHLLQVSLPNSLISIGDNAFYYCYQLNTINIPNSVVKIGAYAFKGCTSLKNISLPDNITFIGSGAFNGCEFANIKLPGKLSKICFGTFFGCKYLESITIPHNVTVIENMAFCQCKNLKVINFPSSLLEIGESAFSSTAVETITMPRNLKKLKKEAFLNCSNLKQVILNSGLQEIGYHALGGCCYTSITIPQSIESLDAYAFVNGYSTNYLSDIYYTGSEKQWNSSSFAEDYSRRHYILHYNSPENAPVMDKVETFIVRCYRLIMSREPDQGGLSHWANKLGSGDLTAAETINQFVNSSEFQNKQLSYGDQVEVLYQVMLNRGSDANGKSYWVSMLNGGNPLGVIIDGFCNSPEFNSICAEYGITPGSLDIGELKPPKEVPVVDMEKIRAFVTRNYRVILGRESDADGLNYWAQRLASGEAAAAEIINGFVNSDEFRNKKLSYGDQVEVLYQVMLDRGSDEAGKAYWVSMLNGGNPLAAIINGFCNSDEFRGICADYGIMPGSVDVGELKPPKEVRVVDTNKIKGYITRCYRVILGREPDQGGLEHWTGKMVSGELEAAAIIDQFVNSNEFMDKQLSDREAIEVLYQAMLGRGSDADGMAYWLARLEAGEPFAVIINGFCNSAEFKGICDEYGITPGSVAVASVMTYAEPEEQEIPKTETIEPEQDVEPTPTDERAELARAFVTHCYQSALLREPGVEEADYYANQIISGQMTAKDVARAFAFSQEFQSKWTDNTAFVRVLYRLCLDREADADGLVYWTDKLANGETAAAVFNALTENKEFVQVCAKYGVPAGVDANAIRAQEEAAAAAEAEANEVPAAPASEFTNEEKIRAFVSCFYRDAMGREADEEGLAYFTGKILNGEATPKDVARDIILSEEFRGRMPRSEELVRILYRVYLGREADDDGLANWAEQLDDGISLESVLNGFAGSEEFASVVNGLK